MGQSTCSPYAYSRLSYFHRCLAPPHNPLIASLSLTSPSCVSLSSSFSCPFHFIHFIFRILISIKLSHHLPRLSLHYHPFISLSFSSASCVVSPHRSPPHIFPCLPHPNYSSLFPSSSPLASHSFIPARAAPSTTNFSPPRLLLGCPPTSGERICPTLTQRHTPGGHSSVVLGVGWCWRVEGKVIVAMMEGLNRQ